MVESNWIQKCCMFFNPKDSWFNHDYASNCNKLGNFNKYNHSRKEHEYKAKFLKKALQYQALNFVFPLKAQWFNDNSEAIFAYLEEVHHEKFH